MRLIDADALIAVMDRCAEAPENAVAKLCYSYTARILKEAPTIDAVPVKFIDEVIEYLTKCRDYAIHEETKTTWDEQRQTLIMLLHEWAAWNECGRTGKYGERREG